MSALLKASFNTMILLVILTAMLVGCSSPTTTPTPDSVVSPSDQQDTKNPVNSPPDEPPRLPDRVDVVYFYRSNPCQCMAVVGDNIKYAVETYFNDELASGKLTFKMLTSDGKANAEVVKKYNSLPFDLFINKVRGKTESIYHVDGIWELMADDQKLIEFVKSSIEKNLKGEE